jgi:hypothetical protein
MDTEVTFIIASAFDALRGLLGKAEEVGLKPNIEKAFEFAADVAKQMITLSSAIIALTVTFTKDFVPNREFLARRTLFAAWISFFVCILTGIGVLLNLAGNLERRVDDLSIYNGGIVLFGFLQVISFLVGLGLVIAFGWRTLRNQGCPRDWEPY